MQTILHWRGVSPRLIDQEDATRATVEIREDQYGGGYVWLMFSTSEDLLTLADQLAELYERIGKPEADPFLPTVEAVNG